MEQQVKTTRIKEGKPLASPMVEPTKSHYVIGDEHDTYMYHKAVEAYNASFVEVENPITFYVNLALYISNGNIIEKGLASKIDGDYPAPEGLTMEVKHLCPNEDSFCDVCNCKQVAVVTFSEPKEVEKEEKPDFEIIDNAETTGEVIITWKTDVGKLKEANIQLQQEITTLRARIAELEKK